MGNINILIEGEIQAIEMTEAMSKTVPPASPEDIKRAYATAKANYIVAYLATVTVLPGIAVQVVPATGNGATTGSGTLQ